jgi:hypothetical protein
MWKKEEYEEMYGERIKKLKHEGEKCGNDGLNGQ